MRAIIGIAGTAFLIGISANVASSDAPTAPQEFTVPESASPGDLIGRIGRDSGEASSATYSIEHPGRSVPVVIDRQTGELTLADTSLDFESQPRHDFIVRARRARPLDPARRAYLADLLASGVDPATMDDLLFETVEQRVAIVVSDAPERPTVSSAPLQLNINASADAGGAQVVADDPDAGDAHTYELIAGDAERFSLDPQSGRLTWRDPAAAVAGSYPVTVRVTDSTGLSDAATFNVEVLIASPSVAVVAPEIIPAQTAATSEPVDSGVTVDPGTAVEDPESVSLGSDSVVVLPGKPGAFAQPDSPQVFADPEPDTDPEKSPAPANAGIVAQPVAAGTIDGMAATQSAGDAGPAAGPPPARSILHWLPLIPVLAGAVFAGVWYLRRRQERLARASAGSLRVVRELPAATVSTASNSAKPPIESIDELLEPRRPALETDHADQAAVHELMATAFQQASGLAQSPMTQPPAPITAEAPVTIGADSLGVAADASIATAVDAVIDETAPESAYGFDAAMQAEAGLAPLPVDAAQNPEPGFGTEPFAMPYPQAEQPVGDQSIEAELEAAHAADGPLPTQYGYGVDDEELSGGYQGLRLSQSSGPAPSETPAPQDFGPIETHELRIAGSKSHPSSPESDPKLQELRRQLSDLFGVPADRPRPIEPSVLDDEPSEEESAIEAVAAEAPAPVPPSPPEAPPTAAAPAAAPLPASDPVNSWLEYLKQRALEKPGAPAAPVAQTSQPYVPKAPSKPAISAASVAAARKNTTPPAPPRLSKSAMREEITMLRDLANRHSRNVLARRALTQRARMTWVLWGAALIVLCFSALWGVRHDAGSVRTLGWVLFGGAVIAFGCCVYGFRCLSHRSADAPDVEELDASRLADDLGSTAAPELMTPEMEQRLRAVLDEARNVPEPVQSR